MTKTGVLTQSSTKRIVAAGLAGLKLRRAWSNGDLGDVMGCGEGTVRNRLFDDEPTHQMTVHELRRLIAAGELSAVNELLADLKVHLEADCPETVADALAVAGGGASCAAALIEAAPDGIDYPEANRLLPVLENFDRLVSGMIQHCRAVIAAGRK